MTNMFSKPKTPEVPQAPVAPTPEELEAEAQKKSYTEQQEFLKKKSRSQTLLTGAGGVEEAGQKKTILG